MNTERFHAIANELKAELAQTDTPTLLSQLVSELQMITQEPSQPAHQQNVAAHREKLNNVLRNAPSNDFSPAWREALKELAVEDLVGERLREQVESTLARNEITPSAAAEEIRPLADRVERLNSALDSLLAAFEFFDIGAEELEFGDFEIGFLIPRGAVHDEFGELGKEFVELKRILGPFLELSTGSRPDVRVRSISSSSFQALLHSAPATALMIATTVERLVSFYEKVMNIRLINQQLRDSDVSDDLVEPLEREAETKMSRGIEEVVEDLLANQVVDLDPGRANELRQELTRSLNAIANRIDRGYAVEVRAGELPEPPEEEPEDAEQDPAEQHMRELTQQVRAMQKQIEFMNPTGKPILHLPEGDGGEDHDAGAATDGSPPDPATES